MTTNCLNESEAIYHGLHALSYRCAWKSVSANEGVWHNELCAAAADPTLNSIRFFKVSTANIHIALRKSVIHTGTVIRIRDAVALDVCGLNLLLYLHVSK